MMTSSSLRFRKFSTLDYHTMLTWVETEGNKDEIKGIECKTKVGVNPVSNIQGFK
jgi:hypothetical protein